VAWRLPGFRRSREEAWWPGGDQIWKTKAERKGVGPDRLWWILCLPAFAVSVLSAGFKLWAGGLAEKGIQYSQLLICW